jgi:hypothetical protein
LFQPIREDKFDFVIGSHHPQCAPLRHVCLHSAGGPTTSKAYRALDTYVPALCAYPLARLGIREMAYSLQLDVAGARRASQAQAFAPINWERR